MIIINEGNTTANVATVAPKNPPNIPSEVCEPTFIPTKVARLMAKGPGVDSATPMKLISSLRVSQPYFSITCCTMGSIA